jgi:hypothetical protein
MLANLAAATFLSRSFTVGTAATLPAFRDANEVAQEQARLF